MLPARPVGRVRDGHADGVAAVQGRGSSASGSTPTSAATRRRKFAAVFARARARGLPAHDALRHRPGRQHRATSARSSKTIGVDRIDHGTNIVEAPDLVDEVKRRGIGLTCCPVSNSFVTDDMKATEIVALLRDDVRVTVNSDDPAYFGGYMTENYAALAAHAGLVAGRGRAPGPQRVRDRLAPVPSPRRPTSPSSTPGQPPMPSTSTSTSTDRIGPIGVASRQTEVSPSRRASVVRVASGPGRCRSARDMNRSL